MNETQFNNLPKYAQDEITLLKREIKRLESNIQEMTGENTDSNVSYNTGLRDFKNLPKDSDVQFKVKGRAINISINRKGWLRIEGAKPLHIQPGAANMIYISQGAYLEGEES